MKTLERDRAIELRREGKTFNEILCEVPVSKGSLSYWLKDIELTDDQLASIKYKNDKIKEKFIKYNALKKNQADIRKKDILDNAARSIENISEKELKLIGIVLYWAEGYKGLRWKSASFTNSDPEMIELMMKWLRIICKVDSSKFRIRIQCHGAEKVKEAEKYWSRITAIPMSQFIKPYVRISPTSKKKMGNLSPYGVCNIRVSDVSLLTQIKGWIQGVGALSSSLA